MDVAQWLPDHLLFKENLPWSGLHSLSHGLQSPGVCSVQRCVTDTAIKQPCNSSALSFQTTAVIIGQAGQGGCDALQITDSPYLGEI